MHIRSAHASSHAGWARRGPPTREMSAAQQQALGDILARHDPGRMNPQEARALVSQISALRIAPGAELSKALRNNGFDMRTLARLAGTKPGEPPATGPSGHAQKVHAAGILEVFHTVLTQLKDVQDLNDSANFQSLLLEKLEEAGLDPYRPIFDRRA